MLTYDMEKECHRVEIIVMPTYYKRGQNHYQFLTLMKELKLDYAPGSIQNILVAGHYH
jgi:hypothetical protein